MTFFINYLKYLSHEMPTQSNMLASCLAGGAICYTLDRAYDLFPTLSPLEAGIASCLMGLAYRPIHLVTSIFFTVIEVSVHQYYGEGLTQEKQIEKAQVLKGFNTIQNIVDFAICFSLFAIMEKQLAVLPGRMMPIRVVNG